MSVQIYNVIKKTASGFHSWVNSDVGTIRKPNNKIDISDEKLIVDDLPIIKKKSLFRRVWNWIKKVIHL